MKGFVSQALALMGMVGSMGGPWKSSVATGVRTTAAVLVPLVIGQLAGDTALAMMLGIGGLNVSLADIGGPYRMKAVTMGVATISLAAAGYLGTVVGRALWLSLPLMFLLASAAGLAGLYGNAAAKVSFLSLILFVLMVGMPAGVTDGAERCMALIGCAIASLWLLTLPVWAVEYRLQVTNIDYRIFASYLDRSRTNPSGQETMQRLETRLDSREFSTAAVLPGRELRLLEEPAYGGQVPARMSFLPATGQQSWTTVVWDGAPGTRVAFVVQSYMAAWQEVWDIATNATGGLRRLTIGGPSLFGGQSRDVPAVSKDFLANAADRGSFVAWLQQRAKPVGGMYLAIGRRHEVSASVDRVYMLLTLPPEPHTFKVVIGWMDHDDRTDDRAMERLLWQP